MRHKNGGAEHGRISRVAGGAAWTLQRLNKQEIRGVVEVNARALHQGLRHNHRPTKRHSDEQRPHRSRSPGEVKQRPGRKRRGGGWDDEGRAQRKESRCAHCHARAPLRAQRHAPARACGAAASRGKRRVKGGGRRGIGVAEVGKGGRAWRRAPCKKCRGAGHGPSRGGVGGPRPCPAQSSGEGGPRRNPAGARRRNSVWSHNHAPRHERPVR